MANQHPRHWGRRRGDILTRWLLMACIGFIFLTFITVIGLLFWLNRTETHVHYVPKAVVKDDQQDCFDVPGQAMLCLSQRYGPLSTSKDAK